jgi:prevent-host-death family protein
MAKLTPVQRAEAFNMHEAKTHFSRLVERVEAGEEIIISRAGRPVARLVPLDARPQARVPGRWRGRVRLAPDFDQTDASLLDAFEA